MKVALWLFGTLMAMSASTTLQAQYYAPPVLDRSLTSYSGVNSPLHRDAPLEAVMAPRRGSVSHDVLVGAAIGAGVGIVTFAIVNSGPGITDHSEDSLGYIASAAAGAGLGMAIGLVIGLTRD